MTYLLMQPDRCQWSMEGILLILAVWADKLRSD
jgi:hypothetical protein